MMLFHWEDYSDKKLYKETVNNYAETIYLFIF